MREATRGLVRTGVLTQQFRETTIPQAMKERNYGDMNNRIAASEQEDQLETCTS